MKSLKLPSKFTPRENFLISILNKVVSEYKALLKFTRNLKPLKIVEIYHLSSIPGETQFGIQVTNKNCIVSLTAANIISNNYDLNLFSDFHAEMIRQAAKGTLIEFLKLSASPSYQVVSKKIDRSTKQHIFTLKTEQGYVARSADELTTDKTLLFSLDKHEIYNLGFIQGSESIIKEKEALLLAKQNHKQE